MSWECRDYRQFSDFAHLIVAPPRDPRPEGTGLSSIEATRVLLNPFPAIITASSGSLPISELCAPTPCEQLNLIMIRAQGFALFINWNGMTVSAAIDCSPPWLRLPFVWLPWEWIHYLELDFFSEEGFAFSSEWLFYFCGVSEEVHPWHWRKQLYKHVFYERQFHLLVIVHWSKDMACWLSLYVVWICWTWFTRCCPIWWEPYDPLTARLE